MKILLLTLISLVLIVSCNAIYLYWGDILSRLFPLTTGVLRAADQRLRNERIRELAYGRSLSRYEDMARKRYAEYVTLLKSSLASVRAVPVANQNARRVYIINPVQNANQVPVSPVPGYQLVNAYPFVAPNASPFQYSFQNQNNDETVPNTETDASNDGVGSASLSTFLDGAKTLGAFIPQFKVSVNSGHSAKLDFGVGGQPSAADIVSDFVSVNNATNSESVPDERVFTSGVN